MPTVAIYGEFTFTQVVGGDGSGMTETVATPFHANILGPFSNKQGGLVYTTAFLEQTDPVARPRPLGEDRRDQPAAAQGLVQARSVLSTPTARSTPSAPARSRPSATSSPAAASKAPAR